MNEPAEPYAAAHLNGPLTFEAMRLDCAERDHVLWWMSMSDGSTRVYHDDFTIEVDTPMDDSPGRLASIDSWRHSLHEDEHDTEEEARRRQLREAYAAAVAGEF